VKEKKSGTLRIVSFSLQENQCLKNRGKKHDVKGPRRPYMFFFLLFEKQSFPQKLYYMEYTSGL